MSMTATLDNPFPNGLDVDVEERAAPAPHSAPDMSGTQKAAILLTAVGIETASKILKSLPDKDVERISFEIAQLKNVSSDRVERVLLEYRDVSMARSYIAEGGPSFAQKALTAALGQARAEDVMFKIQAATEVSAFHLLQTIDTKQVAEFLSSEHPQTIAFILANLSSRKAAEIASALDPERQREAMYRLAQLGDLTPDVVAEFEEIVREQMGPILGGATSASGGINKVAEILNSVSRSAERVIMEGIAAKDAELAASIKNLMFVFDDLINVSDKDLQRLLVQVDQKDLVIGMKGASESLQAKILANVSERASVVIKEELDLMGPVKVSDVEEAQRNILDVASGLEDKGEISLAGAEEEQVVG